MLSEEIGNFPQTFLCYQMSRNSICTLQLTVARPPKDVGVAIFAMKGNA